MGGAADDIGTGGGGEGGGDSFSQADKSVTAANARIPNFKKFMADKMRGRTQVFNGFP
jgi:hypothetical protein